MNTIQQLSLSIPCPRCGAKVFAYCWAYREPMAPFGQMTTIEPHQERIEAAIASVGHARAGEGDLPELKELEKSDGK